MKLFSLRRALLGAIIVPLALAIAAMAGSAMWVTQRAVDVLLDNQMRQEAQFLLLLARHEATEGEALGLVHAFESKDFKQLVGVQTGFRIWSADIIMAQSATMPATRLPPAPGFTNHDAGGERWRTYAVHYSDLPVTVEIGQSLRLRRVLVEQLAYSLALPLLFLILAVAVIIFYQVRAAMRPMQRLSQQLDQRAAGDFERLRGHRMPAEIAPLFEAFNRLIERMQTAIVREREFADNAAHELRTPLAVLKARAQIVVRDLAGDPARQEPARQLAAATDRATGVIDQLLFLGRLAASDAPRQAIDLSELVADVARELAPAAIAKAQNFEVAIAPAITVAGQPEALMMVVRNLIDNAVRYTPRGGNIEVTLAGAGPDTAELAVCDNGPGIPETHHLSILDRFARLPSQESGSGLGLSIVQQIVERHAGHLALANRDPCGLSATVRLPILPAAG